MFLVNDTSASQSPCHSRMAAALTDGLFSPLEREAAKKELLQSARQSFSKFFQQTSGAETQDQVEIVSL